MNKILFYNSLGENVLTLSQKYDETTDGEVKNINAFFACDDFSAELQTSTCEMEADLYQDFDFSNVESFKIFDKNNSLIGKFFPSNIENQRKNIYIIEGISSIGKAEEIKIINSYAENMPLEQYLNEMFINSKLNFIIDEQIKNDIITVGFKDEDIATGRELLQKLAFGNGYVVSDFKIDGITIKPKTQTKRIYKTINFDNVFSDYSKENISQEIGIINVNQKRYMEGPSDTDRYESYGYVKVNNGNETFINIYDDFILNKQFAIEGIYEQPKNEFTNNKDIKKYINSFYDIGQGHYASEYVTIKPYANGGFSYTFDLEKLQEVADLLISTDVIYEDESGEQYALFSVSYKTINISVVNPKANIKLSDLEDSTQIILPIAKDDIVSRLSKYYARKESLNVKIKYDNFELGEIFKIYDIFKSKKYGILKELDLTFSYSNIFADCKLDILSDEEVQNIQTAKYGTAIYGVTRYGEEILN